MGCNPHCWHRQLGINWEEGSVVSPHACGIECDAFSCTKVYKISKYETIRETWDGIFMTCGSRVAPWVSVRLLLAEYMRKLPYNRSRTREAELMLRLCSSFEQWGCVGATFKLCSAFSEIIRCSTARCKDSVSRWSSGWTGSNTKKFARHNWLSMF